MKLQFEPNLDHQDAAIHAVTGLFTGTAQVASVFTVLAPGTSSAIGGQFSLADIDSTGYGNRWSISSTVLLKNLQAVQRANGLLQSKELSLPWEQGAKSRGSKRAKADPGADDVRSLWSDLGGRIFTVEMETGTGKTYVYLRTIYELHKLYGLSKFVIVVPSVAVREGVWTSIKMMSGHFASLYDGVTPDAFVYDGRAVERVRSYATSSRLEIMILTVAAFNKDANIMNNTHEGVGNARPIDVLANTHPIVIVDEPQSVEGGDEGKGLAAILRLRPFCILRYSATPRRAYHRVHRLDAVGAYQRKLVKRIEVAAATLLGTESRPYVRLVGVKGTSTTVTARAEVQVHGVNRVLLKVRELRENDDLELLTGLAQYSGCRIGEIRRTPRAKGEAGTMRLVGPGVEQTIEVGEEFAGISPEERERHMVRRTIVEHLDKELALLPRGIKVLSLVFIDSVQRYRTYDAAGEAQLGALATMFEEEYEVLRRKKKYASLEKLRPNERVRDVHDGYFSIDKKGGWLDTVESSLPGREASERAYGLIMNHKEKLLSLQTPLRFIFSHSALREGWDNPNVFQICVLRQMAGESPRRQTIGRGLRLAVDRSGARVRDPSVNRLTVVAWESYETFAEQLQREIQDETGYRFGLATVETFLPLSFTDAEGEEQAIGEGRATELIASLRAAKLIDAEDCATPALKKAVEGETVPIPESCKPFAAEILGALRMLTTAIEVTDADQRGRRSLRRAVLDSEAFRELWARINAKTLFRVSFDEDSLIAACADAVAKTDAVRPLRVQWSLGSLQVDAGGVTPIAETGQLLVAEPVKEHAPAIPDLLAILEEATKLTRRTLCRILVDSGRLEDVRINPQQFLDQAKLAILKKKQSLVTDGIVYRRLFGEVYGQELFHDLEDAVLEKLVASQRSPHDFVEVDSEVERSFVEELEREDSVKVYAKLPPSFVIPTPLGRYNPDWAVVVERDGVDRVYFVLETKSSRVIEDLRHAEAAKIACAKKHFEAIATEDRPARYAVVTSLGDLVVDQA